MKSVVASHFDNIAVNYDYYKSKNKYYYDNLKSLLKTHVLPNKKVMEIGCGTGDLLAYLKPKIGYGVDISSKMIINAQKKYGGRKNLHFSTVNPKGKFDYVVMSDVIEHLRDPKKVIGEISTFMDKNSIFICTMANPIWEPVLFLAEKLGLKMPEGPHNRISYKKIKDIVNDAGLEIIKHDYTLLMPVRIGIVSDIINKYLEKYIKRLAFIEYFIAKKA